MAAGTQITKIGVNNGESVGIAVSLKEAGVSIIPDTVSFTLLDGSGQIVNGRIDTPASPGNPTIIHLTPEDTTLSSDSDEQRFLTVKSVYTSRIIQGSGSMDDGGGDNIEDESGTSIGPEFAGASCVMVRQWRFVVKYLKQATPV